MASDSAGCLLCWCSELARSFVTSSALLHYAPSPSQGEGWDGGGYFIDYNNIQFLPPPLACVVSSLPPYNHGHAPCGQPSPCKEEGMLPVTLAEARHSRCCDVLHNNRAWKCGWLVDKSLFAIALSEMRALLNYCTAARPCSGDKPRFPLNCRPCALCAP